MEEKREIRQAEVSTNMKSKAIWSQVESFLVLEVPVITCRGTAINERKEKDGSGFAFQRVIFLSYAVFFCFLSVIQGKKKQFLSSVYLKFSC